MEARECIEKIREAGYCDSRVERVLDFPDRVLSKIYDSAHTPEPVMLAVLRTLATFPWLILVAESGFDEETAKRIHQEKASEHLLMVMRSV
jgi:hypothetical protein